MIDREYDVRAYEEGYRAGKHDAQVEIERLRAALKLIADGKETEPRILASAMLEEEGTTD